MKIKKIFITICFIFAAIVLSFTLTNNFNNGTVLAAQIPMPASTPTNLPTTNIDSVISKIFNIIVTVGEIAFIIMLLVGGVMFITSGGDEAGGTKAKKMILNAVIGIVVLLSAWAIATWVLSQFS